MDVHFGRHKVFRAGKSTRKLSLKTVAKRQLYKVVTPRCQEKPLRRIKVPVPQTDTGRRDEYSKALG
jgi:hypothetical protein